LRPAPGTTGLTHAINAAGYGASHQITTINQNDGTPVLGTTQFTYDTRGDRSSDDNTSTLTNDRRDYTYDGRGNVVNVRGQYQKGGAWHYYDVASAFDARNRRVFKSFYDETTLETAQWFFYYDARDRLSEVRYTPKTSDPTTYSTFQLIWLEGRMVLYWQTDYPSATTTKRYVGSDETGRPVDMICWGVGNCPRVWSINPSAWGDDKVLVGAGIFQPLVFAGQYRDDETVAWQNDGVTVARPALVWNHARTYDPFTGGYLQVDPKLPQTWSGYGYADGNPVGYVDPTGKITRDTDPRPKEPPPVVSGGTEPSPEPDGCEDETDENGECVTQDEDPTPPNPGDDDGGDDGDGGSPDGGSPGGGGSPDDGGDSGGDSPGNGGGWDSGGGGSPGDGGGGISGGGWSGDGWGGGWNGGTGGWGGGGSWGGGSGGAGAWGTGGRSLAGSGGLFGFTECTWHPNPFMVKFVKRACNSCEGHCRYNWLMGLVAGEDLVVLRLEYEGCRIDCIPLCTVPWICD
jgi:RHS repeat-associated protein